MPAVRIEVVGSDGRLAVPEDATVLHLERPFGRASHAVTRGEFEVDVPAGTTRVTAERGGEFVPAFAEIELADGQRGGLCLRPRRWINMNAAGWFGGDLHGHRDPRDMPRLLASEGLNVGSSIATHNGADQWSRAPASRWTWTGGSVFSSNDAELERLEGGPGAIVGVGLRRPLRFSTDLRSPTDADVADWIHRGDGLVDAEKPFWPLTPALVALGKIDTVGIACNHFGRDWTYLRIGSIGGVEPDAGVRTPADLVEWITGLYHRFLNCGFAVGVSGGSASGWMPNPPGHARTYVHLGRAAELCPSHWLRNLGRGHSFATTGPALALEVDGHGPGERVPATDGVRRVLASAYWWRSIDRLEILHNGDIIAEGTPLSGSDRRRLVAEVHVRGGVGGWIAARAVRVHGARTDLAHTSPVRLAGPPPHRRVDDAAFLRKWVERVAERADRTPSMPSPRLPDTLRAAYLVYRRLENARSGSPPR